jgi:hypothetical protein
MPTQLHTRASDTIAGDSFTEIRCYAYKSGKLFGAQKKTGPSIAVDAFGIPVSRAAHPMRALQAVTTSGNPGQTLPRRKGPRATHGFARDGRPQPDA